MSGLCSARALKDKAGRVNGLDWDEDGEVLVVSADDESVHVYTKTGEISRTLHSKKYGVSSIKFVHQGSKVCVCASRVGQDHDYAVRLWDLVENRYIRYFSLGAQVCKGVGLCVHPTQDKFVASCTDGCIRAFNLDQDQPVACIGCCTKKSVLPVAGYDCQGLTLICYLGQMKLHFFDSADIQKGEFMSLSLESVIAVDEHIRSISGSPDCQTILVSTTNYRLLLLDAFTAALTLEFSFPDSCERGSTCGYPTFTPDGGFVICGGGDRRLHIWNAPNAQLLSSLSGHAGVPMHAAFNPRKALLASGCLNVVLWQPPCHMR
eukprot:GHVS01091426.1.p1 GENE.GHVS01091426.1~~GHVS01091426.1.p1  ORF type:complete len:344 (+),score=37.33 GHVS01091426.1:74-1033(+)